MNEKEPQKKDGRVLGELWFPVGEVSLESIRERATFTALPPHYALHVWFARRPLVASRAAILLSIIKNDVDKQIIKKILGIPTNIDIVKISQNFFKAKASGQKANNPFSWGRSFKHIPSQEEKAFIEENLAFEKSKNLLILDPMAGGGSIPLETIRLGLDVIAGDLNPVAFLCLKGTVEYPAKFGNRLIPAVKDFCDKVHREAKKELEQYFPKPDNNDIFSYVWARTVKCQNCGLVVPLSPNWWIVHGDDKGVGAHLIIKDEENLCYFEIVKNPKEKGLDPDKGTVSNADGQCPRCRSVIDGDYIKAEVQAGHMGHQMYCVCTKTPKIGKKGREWVFRSPTMEEISATKQAYEKVLIDFNNLINQNLIPTNEIKPGLKTRELLNFGMKNWSDLFNPRQLFAHAMYLQKFKEAKQELFSGITKDSEEWDFACGVAVYGAIVFDGCLDYNSILSLWDPTRIKIAHTMGLQGFPFKWSYAEFDHSSMLWPWIQKKTIGVLSDIVALLPQDPGKSTVFQANAQSINLSNCSVDAIVIDPPYSDNVMYAEVSDFFYVWLRILMKDIYPEEFRDELTNKTDEAVANPARFSGIETGSSKKLADQDYAAKMEASFKEMHRVLRDDGVLCVMFTHRKSEAWVGLAESLMNAGFTFSASWPVHTEPGGKFGKAGKGALKVTVLLYSRKRQQNRPGRWEEIVDEIREKASDKVKEYAKMGILGPDLLVSVYGPALGVFADYYPVKDVSGKARTSGDALTVVAQVVNEFITGDIKGADMETLAYLNLIRNFPGLDVEYDLARISTVFGGNTSVDTMDIKGGSGLIQKAGGKVKILTAHKRVEAGLINPDRPGTLRGLIDIVHSALVLYERQGIESVKQMLQQTGRDASDSGVMSVLHAIGRLGEDGAGASDLVHEARIANALLGALGQEPEGVLKKGEMITHWFE
ncbi:hypothetical protein METP3_01009 [Methanosarcinales archaeon]|nr:hypothetical protein METP3_01009 [Methanosarcinales archaeon]